MTAALRIVVYGLPAPQGSKRALTHRTTGRPVVIESGHARVQAWREDVKAVALDARGTCPCDDPDCTLAATIDGPVSVAVTFTLPKPRTVNRRYPHLKPDLDKLTRSTFDALTAAGVWADDARVVRLVAEKTYPGGAPGALDSPGAVVSVHPVTD